MGKIDVKNMDLYYSSFHALKNINLEIPVEEMTKSMASKEDYRVHWSKRLRKIHIAEILKPYERSCGRLQDHRRYLSGR